MCQIVGWQNSFDRRLNDHFTAFGCFDIAFVLILGDGLVTVKHVLPCHLYHVPVSSQDIKIGDVALLSMRQPSTE